MAIGDGVKTFLLVLVLALGTFTLPLRAQSMPQAMPQTAPQAISPSGPTLGPQDQIELHVTSYPELKTVTRIAADGVVVLPLIGDVTIGGLTAAAAARVVAAQYAARGFIKTPTVRIEITDYQSRKASVLGEVNAQGLVVLDRNYSVAEILAKAGGLADNAADTAVIIRQKPGGVSERINIDIGELVGSGGTGALTLVEAGDVVFVPKAPTFSVIGAINRPGTFALRKGMTVDQAIAAAGDINNFGLRSRLKIRRTPASGGSASTIPVTLNDPLQPGDVLVVGERVF